MYLLDVLRSKPHTLSQQEEKILARAGQMADGPGSVYTIFSNAEMPYPEIALSNGTVATLNKSGYALHRASANRQDREAVFQAFWSATNQFRQTFGVPALLPPPDAHLLRAVAELRIVPAPRPGPQQQSPSRSTTA